LSYGIPISPAKWLSTMLTGQMSKDKDGITAAAGEVNEQLVNHLNKLDFYRLSAPKSLGKEWVEHTFMPVLQAFNHLSIESQLASCVEHIAFQMAQSIKTSGKQNRLRLLATGGGTFNTYLMERFAYYLEGICVVEIPDPQTIAFKEALIFALLGGLRWHQENNVLSSATGSTRDHCGGALYGI
jgi:anhydro-N-acetylmuramic acid kinase